MARGHPGSRQAGRTECHGCVKMTWACGAGQAEDNRTAGGAWDDRPQGHQADSGQHCSRGATPTPPSTRTVAMCPLVHLSSGIDAVTGIKATDVT